MATYPITKRGSELLKAELHKLKTVERPSVIQAIAEARAQGDLSENADYDAAKERQGFIEGRIKEVEGKLSNAQIIDPALLDAWCLAPRWNWRTKTPVTASSTKLLVKMKRISKRG